jgi:CRP/FNR family transcriptional regulator, cyclic AMP receptor protein
MPKLITPKIDQDTPAYLVGTTQSRVSFSQNTFRKPGFVDYQRKLLVHSSFLISAYMTRCAYYR